MTTAQKFIQLALKKQVLKFGQFTLKSGRVSPYFFNAGLFDDGQSLLLLGQYYAQSLKHSGIAFDMLYGPAYKGIPIATAVAIAYEHLYGINIPVAFNRKEVKDHGEGGVLIGAALTGKVLIIDDVVSAGTSGRESIDIIKANKAEVAGISVALDRQERGQGSLSAIGELKQSYGLQTVAIASLDDLIVYLADDTEKLTMIKAYKNTYGS
ncbi:MAG TPA: orotate phosphoribosyltransferase [Oceanospirillales bacterium]|nr:orotate phosphoribosyltransferase [Oceanospirillales bacterium]